MPRQRLRLEEAVLDVASRRWSSKGEAGAIAVLADACQQRVTTAARLGESLVTMPRLPGRSFLRAVLDDVATGAYSLLEQRYLTRVERAHGLPAGQRQIRFDDGRVGFRDVRYVDQNLLLELDGRLGHEFALDQWADLIRDVQAATQAQMTLRLGWGPVTSACRLAPLIGEVLNARGWVGKTHRCKDCPDNGGSPAPGACDPPLS